MKFVLVYKNKQIPPHAETTNAETDVERNWRRRRGCVLSKHNSTFRRVKIFAEVLEMVAAALCPVKSIKNNMHYLRCVYVRYLKCYENH